MFLSRIASHILPLFAKNKENVILDTPHSSAIYAYTGTYRDKT